MKSDVNTLLYKPPTNEEAEDTPAPASGGAAQ